MIKKMRQSDVEKLRHEMCLLSRRINCLEKINSIRVNHNMYLSPDKIINLLLDYLEIEVSHSPSEYRLIKKEIINDQKEEGSS